MNRLAPFVQRDPKLFGLLFSYVFEHTGIGGSNIGSVAPVQDDLRQAFQISIDAVVEFTGHALDGVMACGGRERDHVAHA